MRLIKITSRFRRDCWATLQCEHCEREAHKVPCYDDRDFWEHHLPARKCGHCGKCSNDRLNAQEESPK